MTKLSETDAETVRRLQEQFAAFRATAKRSARIPAVLREGVLAAIDAGVPILALNAALKLGGNQIHSWRRSGSKIIKARVLDVVPAHSGGTQVAASAGVSPVPGMKISYEPQRLTLEFSF